jgi:hypothetical protein
LYELSQAMPGGNAVPDDHLLDFDTPEPLLRGKILDEGGLFSGVTAVAASDSSRR